VISFTTTADLSTRLQALSGTSVDAVFHAAAVSDFAFGKVFVRESTGALVEASSGKFSTRHGSLLAELVPTPKILPRLRGWFPPARLVGWKFEIDGDRSTAIAAGLAQLESCGTDACVVNGPAYGLGFGLLAKGSDCHHASNASSLFHRLEADLKRQGPW
jgi:phosphopantothenoylcysteine decarboxylase/phosphopantothenate--cysteine ligase